MNRNDLSLVLEDITEGQPLALAQFVKRLSVAENRAVRGGH